MGLFRFSPIQRKPPWWFIFGIYRHILKTRNPSYDPQHSHDSQIHKKCKHPPISPPSNPPVNTWVQFFAVHLSAAQQESSFLYQSGTTSFNRPAMMPVAVATVMLPVSTILLAFCSHVSPPLFSSTAGLKLNSCHS